MLSQSHQGLGLRTSPNVPPPPAAVPGPSPAAADAASAAAATWAKPQWVMGGGEKRTGGLQLKIRNFHRIVHGVFMAFSWGFDGCSMGFSWMFTGMFNGILNEFSMIF